MSYNKIEVFCSTEMMYSTYFPTQVKMLQALGLKSTLITDGTTPINLFNTAQGLIGNALTAPNTENN